MSATPRGKNILLFFGTWCNLISRCPWSLRSLRSSGETDSFSKEDFYISTLRLQAFAEVVSCCSEPDGLWKFFGSELFSQKFICLRFHMNQRKNALLWWRAEPEREKQKPVFDLWPQAPLMVFTRQTQTWISSTAALKTLHQQPAHIWAGRLCESLTSLFILRTVWQWGTGRGGGGWRGWREWRGWESRQPRTIGKLSEEKYKLTGSCVFPLKGKRLSTWSSSSTANRLLLLLTVSLHVFDLWFWMLSPRSGRFRSSWSPSLSHFCRCNVKTAAVHLFLNKQQQVCRFNDPFHSYFCY